MTLPLRESVIWPKSDSGATAGDNESHFVRPFLAPMARDDTNDPRPFARGSGFFHAGDSLDGSWSGRGLQGAGGADREIVGTADECRVEARRRRRDRTAQQP